VALAHGAQAFFGGVYQIDVTPNPVGISLGPSLAPPVGTWHVTYNDQADNCDLAPSSGSVDVGGTNFWVAPDLSAAELLATIPTPCGPLGVQVNWTAAGGILDHNGGGFTGLVQPATTTFILTQDNTSTSGSNSDPGSAVVLAGAFS
jgi:hypothetical protein